MDCPRCGADGVRVRESRKDTDGTRMRRRQCVACDLVFYSLEVVIPNEAVMYRRVGERTLMRRKGYRTVTFS